MAFYALDLGEGDRILNCEEECASNYIAYTLDAGQSVGQGS